MWFCYTFLRFLDNFRFFCMSKQIKTWSEGSFIWCTKGVESLFFCSSKKSSWSSTKCLCSSTIFVLYHDLVRARAQTFLLGYDLFCARAWIFCARAQTRLCPSTTFHARAQTRSYSSRKQSFDPFGTPYLLGQIFRCGGQLSVAVKQELYWLSETCRI